MKDLRKFSNDDYGLVRTIRSVQASPDGRYALYPVQSMNIQKDAYQTDLWVAEGATGREFQLTSGGRANGAFWLDEYRVLFSSVRGDASPGAETVYYCIDVRGGEAQEYMRIPKAGAQVSHLEGERFLVRAETDCNRPEEGAAEKWMTFDEYPYLGDGGMYANKMRRALFLWDNGSKELKQLTPDLMQTQMPFFSDDVLVGKDGFWFAAYSYDRDAAGMACVYKYVWETGELQELCRDSCYVFSMARREDRIYYGAWAIEPGPAIASIRIKSVSEQGGDLRIDAEPDWELGSVRQRDGQTVFVRTYRAESTMSVWKDGLTYENLPTPGINPIAVAPTGDKIYFVGWEKDCLAEVYVYEKSQITRLSHQNDRLFAECAFSACEPLTARDGEDEICGWVMKPVGYEPGKSYPGILFTHGGPHGYYSAAFNQELQRFVSEGYFVFFCNPRGSTSYGVPFMNVTGDLGGRDFSNILAFTDTVLAAYPDLAPGSLAITGQSYGGYLSNWAIGQTDRFKAAIPRMSISNWISMHGTSVERWYGDHVVGAMPWNNLELLWKQSPLRYAPQVTTPTLFIQHEKDQYCPMEQAQQMFVALLERGVPTKLVCNLGCGHGGRRVSQLLHDIDVMLAWLGEYLK